MDVDARERRPGGGGRGSHEASRPVVNTPPGLFVIEEPEAAAQINVAAPWPRQVDWASFCKNWRADPESCFSAGMENSDYKGPERRSPKSNGYPGPERRRVDWPFKPMTAKQREEGNPDKATPGRADVKP